VCAWKLWSDGGPHVYADDTRDGIGPCGSATSSRKRGWRDRVRGFGPHADEQSSERPFGRLIEVYVPEFRLRRGASERCVRDRPAYLTTSTRHTDADVRRMLIVLALGLAGCILVPVYLLLRVAGAFAASPGETERLGCTTRTDSRTGTCSAKRVARALRGRGPSGGARSALLDLERVQGHQRTRRSPQTADLRLPRGVAVAASGACAA